MVVLVLPVLKNLMSPIHFAYKSLNILGPVLLNQMPQISLHPKVAQTAQEKY